MTHFHAGANMPGYMPEGDNVARFDTADSAWAHVADVIQEDWDAEYDSTETSDERLEIDARYLPAHSQVNLTDDSGMVHVPGPTETHLGRNYWVSECSEDDCTDDD